MIVHYVKTGLRSFVSNKAFSIINIAGLGIGMACCLLIILWVQDEIGMDRFHENGDRICLVGSFTKYGTDGSYSMNTPPALAGALKHDFPEIIRATRINNTGAIILTNGDASFFENLLTVDPDFLNIFSFALLRGNAGDALEDPFSIILTESMAEKYFAEEDPVGQVLHINSRYPFTVTGIIADAPGNSSLRFSGIIPFVALETLWSSPDYARAWTNWNLYTYVELHPQSEIASVEAKIASRLREGTGNDDDRIFLEPFETLRLFGFRGYGGRIGSVILMSFIAALLLAIACLNFMNLSTARSAWRSKEVGLRKVTGAFRGDIIRQFFTESFLFTVVSLVLAIGLVELLLPAFNRLSGKELVLNFIAHPELLWGLLAVTAVTGLVAGSYPALYMSHFNPIKILAGMAGTGHKKRGFRRSIVIVQFTISIVLAVATIIVYKQMDYMMSMDTGIDRSDLAFVYMTGDLREQGETLKYEMLRHPDVLHAAQVSNLPTGVYTNGSGWQWDGRAPGTNPLVTYYCADTDFLDTFGARLVHGDFFSERHQGKASYSHGDVVINERMARIMGAENPVGMQLANYGRSYTIIGVVNDFHFKPVSRSVGPLLIYHKAGGENYPNRFKYLFVKLAPGAGGKTIGELESICAGVSSGYPPSITMLRDAYSSQFDALGRYASIVKYGAAFMIFVSCLGLFGLAAYTAEQRTKEIGIRKILGASMPTIYRLLGKDILVPVLIANGIGWVVSFVFLSTWLNLRFAFTASVGIMPFLLVGLVSVGLALLSVSVQIIRAASQNPVESLRHE